MEMEPVTCGNCKEDLDKNKVVFNCMDKTGIDVMVFCEKCNHNNHISFGAPYLYTWEKETWYESESELNPKSRKRG